MGISMDRKSAIKFTLVVAGSLLIAGLLLAIMLLDIIYN